MQFGHTGIFRSRCNVSGNSEEGFFGKTVSGIRNIDLPFVMIFLSCIGIFENRIQENDVNCCFECDGNLRVSGKRNMLIQTLINLLDNALDAVESNLETGACGKGEIRIRSRELVEGVEISIRDNGGGILPDDLEKVFRPYYSSKGEKGSGLGLAICRNIIQKDFGGSLTVRNVEQGAEFTIFLPRYGGNADE
jgi:signal transduction histidine kinase